MIVGRVRPDQAGDDGGGNLAAMDVGAVQEIQVVIGIDMRAGLQADDGAEALGCSSARCSAMRPPIEHPIAMGLSSSSAVMMSRIIVVYCAEVSRYSSLCQPAGGDDLPCQGMSKAMDRGGLA